MTTDEAAVEQRHRDFANQFWLHTFEKADLAKRLARFEAERTATERQRAERAEKMLEEAVAIIEGYEEHGDLEFWGCKIFKERSRALTDELAKIRSADNG